MIATFLSWLRCLFRRRPRPREPAKRPDGPPLAVLGPHPEGGIALGDGWRLTIVAAQTPAGFVVPCYFFLHPECVAVAVPLLLPPRPDGAPKAWWRSLS